MKTPNPWHKLPIEWRPIFDPETHEFLAYAHSAPCSGALVITTGNPFGPPPQTASCDNCTGTGTRPDARHTWRREE